mgnify:CR=1 FL=1
MRCARGVGGEVPAVEVAVLAVDQHRAGERVDRGGVDAPLLDHRPGGAGLEASGRACVRISFMIGRPEIAIDLGRVRIDDRHAGSAPSPVPTPAVVVVLDHQQVAASCRCTTAPSTPAPPTPCRPSRSRRARSGRRAWRRSGAASRGRCACRTPSRGRRSRRRRPGPTGRRGGAVVADAGQACRCRDRRAAPRRLERERACCRARAGSRPAPCPTPDWR